eukprot:6413637-Prymnesium_polylepis.1
MEVCVRDSHLTDCCRWHVHLEIDLVLSVEDERTRCKHAGSLRCHRGRNRLLLFGKGGSRFTCQRTSCLANCT